MNEGWSDLATDRPIAFWKALRDDIRAHLSPAEQTRSLLKPAIKIVLISSGFHATLNYRISHSLRYRFGIVGRLLAVSCFWWGRHIYGCSISPVARLHGGLIMPHPQGIVIGAGAVLGPRGWIFQNVTIGGAPEKVGLPQVGADSRIFAGAVLVGPIVIGDNVVVGANAVVYRDVPARSIARSPGFEVYPLPDRLIVGVSDQDSVV